MPSLPNGNRAEVDRQKIIGYALDATHGLGRHKARVFRSVLGLGPENADVLVQALEEYRLLTKASHGIRPRDLMVEFARMLASIVGVTSILAVSDACRHHRSPYFAKDVGRPLPLNYDEVWRERGASAAEDGFFALPIVRQVRAESDIPAKKRAMYRDRYELLGRLEKRMRENFPRLSAVVRPDAD